MSINYSELIELVADVATLPNCRGVAVAAAAGGRVDIIDALQRRGNLPMIALADVCDTTFWAQFRMPVVHRHRFQLLGAILTRMRVESIDMTVVATLTEHKAVLARIRTRRSTAVYMAATFGLVGMLEWFAANSGGEDSLIYYYLTRSILYAALGDDLATVVWLRQNIPGSAWNAELITYAALGNSLDTIKWARMRGCSWDEGATLAAVHRNVPVLYRWLRANGCPIDERAYTGATRSAARYDIWRELVPSMPVPGSHDAAITAVRAGDCAMLRSMQIATGLVRANNLLHEAILIDHLPALRTLIDCVAYVDVAVCMSAVLLLRANILRYIVSIPEKTSLADLHYIADELTDTRYNEVRAIVAQARAAELERALYN